MSNTFQQFSYWSVYISYTYTTFPTKIYISLFRTDRFKAISIAIFETENNISVECNYMRQISKYTLKAPSKTLHQIPRLASWNSTFLASHLRNYTSFASSGITSYSVYNTVSKNLKSSIAFVVVFSPGILSIQLINISFNYRAHPFG